MTETPIYEFYSSVKEKEIKWLWFPYIPYGKITILQGDPGEGKSTFVLNLIARITTGGEMPDGSGNFPKSSVIYQCAEDSNEDTVKPRLLNAGADCSRVAFIKDDENALTLSDSRIEETIKETGAKLVVLDPIQAFVPQEGDMKNAQVMRSIMRKLAGIAEKYDAAIIIVGHLNKAFSGKNIYRGLGSIDIAAIARSILMISRDEEVPQIRYMYQIKSNLAPEGSGIGFIFDLDKGFRWLGKCDVHFSDDEGRVPISKRDEAKRVLKSLLIVGDIKSKEAYSKLKGLSISERTVRTAIKEMKIKAYRKNGEWYLTLKKT